MAAASGARIQAAALVVLVALAILLCYIDRGTIGVVSPLIIKELGLTAETFGIAVSAFFWVYAPIQLLLGWLCDRVSVYRLLAAGLALWSLSTAATGLVSSLAMLVGLRVLLGLGESIAFPAASKIVAHNVSTARRGIANATVGTALALGPALGTFIGGTLTLAVGWRWMFAICGVATLLWLVPWGAVTRRIPAEHAEAARRPYPIARIAATRAVWSTSVGHFCVNYGFYFLLAWLPLYLVRQRGFDLATVTAIATTVYLVQGASAVATGWLCDARVARGADPGSTYRLSVVLGLGLVTISILGIALAGDLRTLGVFLLLAGLGSGPLTVNMFGIAQVFAGPRAAGTYIGIQNAVANLAGIIGPIVTGVLVGTTGSFLTAFYAASAVSALGVLCWMLFVPRIQPLALDD